MNMPIYYTCKNCVGSFPCCDYDMGIELCNDCLKAKKDAVAKLQLQRWVIYLCCFMALALVIMGRFETFHDTEMEALFNGWRYWLGTLFFGGIALGMTGR